MLFSNKTVKHCSPFLDTFTSGYIVELWQDVQVVRTINGPEISWPVEPPPINSRVTARGLETFPVPAGCLPIQYVWSSPYIFKTPPGYSILITHPFNRFDLPFITLSGIVDSDFMVPEGDIPFYLKENFEGIIEEGTPIFQVFPFKRDDWASEVDYSLVPEMKKSRWMSFRTSKGIYRDKHWKKKRYE